MVLLGRNLLKRLEREAASVGGLYLSERLSDGLPSSFPVIKPACALLPLPAPPVDQGDSFVSFFARSQSGHSNVRLLMCEPKGSTLISDIRLPQ